MNNDYLYQTAPHTYSPATSNHGISSDVKEYQLGEITGNALFMSPLANRIPSNPLHGSTSALQYPFTSPHGSLYTSMPVSADRRNERPLLADDIRLRRPPRSPVLIVPASIADAAAAIVERSHIELEGASPVFRQVMTGRKHPATPAARRLLTRNPLPSIQKIASHGLSPKIPSFSKESLHVGGKRCT